MITVLGEHFYNLHGALFINILIAFNLIKTSQLQYFLWITAKSQHYPTTVGISKSREWMKQVF